MRNGFQLRHSQKIQDCFARFPETIQKLFQQGYQGARYSFGYPACPDLADQAKLDRLMGFHRVGVRLTENFQLEPEHATSALVVHHPEARYFSVD